MSAADQPRERAALYAGPVPIFDAPVLPAKLRRGEWDIRPISQQEATWFMVAEHYARGAANTSVARHGLFLRDYTTLLGVAIWMPPTRQAAESIAPDHWQGVLNLSRLAVNADVPTNGASFLLGGSMRLIDRQRWPVLLTYADTALGHTGAIYRATNWDFVGATPAGDTWVGPDGEQRGRKRGGRTLTAAEMRSLGFERRPSAPKLKFVHRRPRPAAQMRTAS